MHGSPLGGEPWRLTGRLRATRGEGGLEADEVVDVEGGRTGGAVAVGVGVAGGEAGHEADEVVDVEDRGVGAEVAVGVAVGRAGYLLGVGQVVPLRPLVERGDVGGAGAAEE